MAVKNQKALLKKLKKQIRVLQRKETQARNKLRSALKKVRKLGGSYRSKLSKKVRAMQGKLSEVQATTYLKVAADVERQIHNRIAAKGKSLNAALTRLEKKFAAKLKKSIAKKAKKAGKVRKARKSAPIKMKKAKRRGRSRRR